MLSAIIVWKKAAYILLLVPLICSCAKYGYLHVIEGDSGEAEVRELRFEHDWWSSLQRYSEGRALYSENVRLIAEHPFGSAEVDPIRRFYELIEISEGDAVVIVIEHEKQFNNRSMSDLHLYIIVQEIVIGRSIRIDADSSSFSIGYDSVRGLRYDLGNGFIEFVSTGDDWLEFIIDIEYMSFANSALETPSGCTAGAPFPIKIEGRVKARKDTALRRIFSRDSYIGSIVSACM